MIQFVTYNKYKIFSSNGTSSLIITSYNSHNKRVVCLLAWWIESECFGLLGPTLSLPYLFWVLCTQLLWGPTLSHPWGYFIDHFSSKNLVFDVFFLTLFCSEANVCSFICNQVALSAKLYLFFFNWCFILNLGNVIKPKGML